MNKLTERLYYTSPAKYWEAALPLGDGRLGAMVFSDFERETIALNEETIWSGRPHGDSDATIGEATEATRKLVDAGKYAKAADLMTNHLGTQDSAAYMPAGELILLCDYPNWPRYNFDYVRELNLETAEITMSFRREQVKYKRRMISSAKAGVLALELTCGTPHALNFSIFFQSQNPGVPSSNAAKGSCYFDSTAPVLNRYGSFKFTDGEKKGVSYRMGARVVSPDGEVTTQDGLTVVRNATSAVIYIAIRTNFKDYKTAPEDTGIDQKALVERDLDNAAKRSYEDLRAEHLKEYQSYYLRSRLTLEGNANDELPTDVRLQNDSKEEVSSPAFAALLYNYGRYLMIAGSRPGTHPTNLQGIWNRWYNAPWGSNYTTNINTEMNYWPAENTNLADCAEPLFHFIADCAENGKKVAKKVYNAPGWCMHHNSDIWRYCAPATGHSVFGAWFSCGAWLCHHLMDHYRYTLDLDFLKQYAPVIRGAAEFMLSRLYEHNGELATFPSTSPENMFLDPNSDGKGCVSYGTQMDMSLVHELFENTLEMDALLGVSDDLTAKIKAALPRLKKPRIGSLGQLLEFDGDFEEAEIHHRHLSHLYGAYPGNEFLPGDKNYIAAMRSIVRRGDQSTGWAMGWRVALWARFCDGDHACQVLRRLLTPVVPGAEIDYTHGGIYVNLFDAHSPFQIDGNFGVTAGMGEMLIQGHRRAADGTPIIQILPALPRTWRKGAVTGLCTHGALTADISWDGNDFEATLTAAKGGVFHILTLAGEQVLSFEPGQTRKLSGNIYAI